MSEKIYKFAVGSFSNSLESVFTAKEAEIDWIVGKDIWYGDVWGKHSSVQLTMNAEDFTVVSEDPAEVENFKKTIIITGEKHNPFNNLDEEQWEDYDAQGF